MALVLATAACNPDSATTGPTQVNGKDFAANLRLVSGDQQVGSVASPLSLPIVVKVVDAGGQPVQGASVSFSVRAGGGSINPALNVSDASGIVSSTWVLGTTLGANKAVAILASSFVLDSASFTATANAGGPKTITITGGNLQASNAGRVLGIPLSIKVVDQFGYAVSGRKVTWAPGNLSGSVAVVSDTTANDGGASAVWTLGTTAVAQSMSATVTGVTAPANFTAAVTPDTGRVLTVTTGQNQTAAAGAALTQLRVTLTDQYGNPIANDAIVWNDSLTPGSTVSPLNNSTDALGQATATWTLGARGGSQSLRVRNGSALRTTFNATSTLAFSEVVAGNFQACAITASNQRAYCWGAGDAGQLGKGVSPPNIPAPTTPVSTAADSVLGPFVQFRQITGGRNSFCALSVARQVFCWGRVIGQSGVSNNVATLNTIVDPRQQILPALVASGEEHYCVLDLAGLGFCTGTNFSGQLGNGTFISPTVGTYPFIIPAPPANIPMSSVAAGKQHTCAFAQNNPPALGANNLVPLCWGLNTTGQVGNAPAGLLVNQPTPTFVTLPVGAPTSFDTTSLALGGQHSCVLSPAGAAWCWGSNGFGQLGKGAAVSSIARDSIMQPVAMPGGATFSKIYAGEYHTCALTSTGAAFCWGRNDYGQLGDGTSTTTGTPVAVAGGLIFRSLSVGEFFTCGVAGNGPGVAPPAVIPGSPSQLPGTVYCWGDNVFGQLGQNTTGNNSPIRTPVKVKFQP